MIKTLCKKAAIKILPSAVLRFVKKRHYLRLARNFSPEREPDLKVIQRLVKPGDYVLDIGANIGIYSKVLSELVGKDGRVYSIEPFPSTFEILSYNLRKLNLRNVEAIKVAISDSEGIVTMGLPCDSSGAETHYRASIVKNTGTNDMVQMTDVQGTSIDARFLGVSKRISFIKCDVEGHELACIKGAKGFLEQARPAWLMEISGDPDETGSSAHLVFEILSSKGYSPWWFDGASLIRRRVGDKSVNYFFLRDKHISALRDSEGLLLLT